MRFGDKKLIAFDLDGTLSPTRTRLDEEVAELVGALLAIKKVAVMSGGSREQFERQLVAPLPRREGLFQNLYLFPTCGAELYAFDGDGWRKLYSEAFGEDEKEAIRNAFARALRDAKFDAPPKLYGEQLEDRGTQITFAALGQDAPREKKETWDPDHGKRKKIVKALRAHIPEFEIRIGGTTSIDVTRKGIDKAYGIRKIEEHLGVQKKDILFIGDALFPGGNDYPAKQAGVDCIAVTGPEETKKIIRMIVENSRGS